MEEVTIKSIRKEQAIAGFVDCFNKKDQISTFGLQTGARPVLCPEIVSVILSKSHQLNHVVPSRPFASSAFSKRHFSSCSIHSLKPSSHSFVIGHCLYFNKVLCFYSSGHDNGKIGESGAAFKSNSTKQQRVQSSSSTSEGSSDSEGKQKASFKFWEQDYRARFEEQPEDGLRKFRELIQNSNIASPSEMSDAEKQFEKYAKRYHDLMHRGKSSQDIDSSPHLTHTDLDGKATMVDVGHKGVSHREASAQARVFLGKQAAELVQENKMKKGDVLTVAQLAGIMAAKQTAQLIPLCHNITLNKVTVSCILNDKDCTVEISSTAKTTGQTGVEMEALMAASVAALTVYDMCKAVTHDMVISDVMLVSKSGGKRDFQR